MVVTSFDQKKFSFSCSIYNKCYLRTVHRVQLDLYDYLVIYHNSEVELIKTKFEVFGVVEYV